MTVQRKARWQTKLGARVSISVYLYLPHLEVRFYAKDRKTTEEKSVWNREKNQVYKSGATFNTEMGEDKLWINRKVEVQFSKC